MNQLRQQWSTLVRNPGRAAALLFALAIPLSGLVNILLYYLGLCLEKNTIRSGLFIVLNLIFSILVGLFFLYTLWKRKIIRQNLILLTLSLLFFVVYYGMAIWKHGLAGPVLASGQEFIAFCVPALMAGAIGAVWQKDTSLFFIVEKASFFLAPACIQYLLGAIFQCNPYNYGADLGIIGYMPWSYTILPVLMALCIQFAKGAPLRIPFQKKPLVHGQRVRGVLITLLWLALLATGTRGTIFCALFFFVLLVIYQFRQKTARKRTAWMCGILVGFYILNLFVVTFPGMQRISRMNVFLTGIVQGELSTSTVNENLTDAQIDALVSSGAGEDAPSSNDEEAPPSSNDEQAPPSSGDQEGTQIPGNRGTLFKVAFQEWKTSPVTGIGPFAYQFKYSLYPHSALLELLCETGIVGIILLLSLLLIAAIRMLRHGEKGWLMLVFLLPYGLNANISGTIWACSQLLFALGYGLALHEPKRSAKGTETE